MKTKYLLSLIFVIGFRILFVFEDSSAQTFSSLKKDTTHSTINPSVQTLATNSFIFGARVPKGFSTPAVVSLTKYSNSNVKLLDTTYSAKTVGQTSFASASDGVGVFCTYAHRAGSNDDVELFKVDANGNILWSTIIGSVSGSGNDNPFSMKIKNGIFVTGTCYSQDRIPTAGQNAFVVKTDLSGNTLWTKFFDGFAATAVEPLANGNSFVVVRSFDINLNTVQKVYLLGVYGNTLCVSTIPSGYSAALTAFHDRTGVLVLGLRQDTGTDAWFFASVNSSGVISTPVNGNFTGQIIEMEGSYAGFVVCGAKVTLVPPSNLAYMAEYSISSMDTLWTRKENGAQQIFTGISKRNNGVGYVFTGTRTRTFWPSSTYDMLYSRMTYPTVTATITPAGTDTICSGQSVTMTANTGAGYTYVWKKGSTILSETSNTLTVSVGGTYKVTITNVYGMSKTSAAKKIVVKICNPQKEAKESEVAEAQVRMEIPEEEGDIKIYPNPATNYLVVEKIKVGEEIVVIDVIGKMVIRQISGSIEEVVDISKLKPGTYFVIVGKRNQKIVKY